MDQLTDLMMAISHQTRRTIIGQLANRPDRFLYVAKLLHCSKRSDEKPQAARNSQTHSMHETRVTKSTYLFEANPFAKPPLLEQKSRFVEQYLKDK